MRRILVITISVPICVIVLIPISAVIISQLVFLVPPNMVPVIVPILHFISSAVAGFVLGFGIGLTVPSSPKITALISSSISIVVMLIWVRAILIGHIKGAEIYLSLLWIIQISALLLSAILSAHLTSKLFQHRAHSMVKKS
jgi:hypothetical protein